MRRDVCIAAVSGTLEIPNIDFLDNKMWGTGNKQTDHFLSMLGLNHIWTCPHVPCAASDMDGEQHNNMDKASSSITTDVMPSSLSELPWPDASIDFADLLNHKRMEIGSQLAEHSV